MASAKKRQKKKNQQKDIEISDLQIQIQEFQKAETAGEKIIAKLNKTCRENENLLKWIDTFSNRVSSQEEEIYNLKLKLYLQSSSSSSSSQPQPPSLSSLQPSPPSFKSMDEYFKYNQVIFIYYIFFLTKFYFE